MHTHSVHVCILTHMHECVGALGAKLQGWLDWELDFWQQSPNQPLACTLTLTQNNLRAAVWVVLINYRS